MSPVQPGCRHPLRRPQGFSSWRLHEQASFLQEIKACPAKPTFQLGQYCNCLAAVTRGKGGTEDGGVAAVGEAVERVLARQHRLYMVLVQVDGRAVAEEVVALLRAAVGPVRVGAPGAAAGPSALSPCTDGGASSTIAAVCRLHSCSPTTHACMHAWLLWEGMLHARHRPTPYL